MKDSLGQKPNKSEVKKVREQYENLIIRQKNLVSNYAALMAAEKSNSFTNLFAVAAMLLIMLVIISILLIALIKKQKRPKY